LVSNSQCCQCNKTLQENLKRERRQTLEMTSVRRNLLELTRKINNFHPDSSYLPFTCESHQVGLIASDVVDTLRKYPETLTVTEKEVRVSPSLDSPQKRNEQIEKMLLDMREKKTFSLLSGWRDECYEIKASFSSKILFKMERSATPLFGVRTYGVHINGYVQHSSLGLCLWLQKRSLNKPTWPGMMDSFVGGGLSEGLGVLETAIKEAGEEANVPRSLAVKMKESGAVTFLHQSERGLHPNTEFVFDLELPESFSPGNNDGEVESFTLLPAQQVADLLCTEQYKATSISIALDWLVRNGIISPDNEPEYPTIIENLHFPLHRFFK